jgi:uncharacterized protein
MITTDAYRDAIEQAHAARVARLRSATGWLSLVGKAFVGQGRMSLGSSEDAGVRLPEGAPPIVGELHVEGSVVRFEAAPDVVVTCGGERVTSRTLRSDREGAADALVVSGFVLELMERGETLALRIRDTRQIPRPYDGIETYPIDPCWRIPAKLVAHDDGTRTFEIDFEGTTSAATDVFVSPGVLVFELRGTEHHLVALYEDSSQRRLFVLFRDATSGVETYGSGRLLYAPLPDADAMLFLDFNLALLPGCAFSSFATCPIAPRENRLTIAVRAGEREYLGEPVGTRSLA